MVYEEVYQGERRLKEHPVAVKTMNSSGQHLAESEAEVCGCGLGACHQPTDALHTSSIGYYLGACTQPIYHGTGGGLC